MKQDEWYWDQNSVHKNAERTFAALPIHNIGTLVTVGAPSKRKEVQMTVIFHLLQFGRPMTKYPPMKEMLQFMDDPKSIINPFILVSVAHVINFV